MTQPSSTTETTAVFTDEDRLQLLQLLTRRAMAERSAAAGAEGQEAKAPGEGADGGALVPERWRLVPEGAVLYEWQRECLPRWLAQGRGTVKVATGGGKTLFALAAGQHVQNDREPDLRLVVVVPTIPLLFQWYDDLRRGNLPESAIGLMGAGQELPPPGRLRVLLCVLNSARDRLPTFVAKAQWAERMLLVVDECHRANAEQARRIFDSGARYTLGLSATPEQDLEAEGVSTNEAYEQGVVGQALGPILFEFTIKQSLAAGLLTPFEVWHVGVPLSLIETSEHARLSREIGDLRKALQPRHRKARSSQPFLAWCQTQASRGEASAADAIRFIGLATRRKRLLYRAEARTAVTLGILSESVADEESRAIVFHESIEEIETLFLRALQLKLPAVLEHSQLPESLRAENINAFREGLARVIVSAKSLVEGFNVPSADLGIVAASSGSVRQRIQSLGRMLRRKAGGRSARIVVLYVRDTEDEAIYEKADWDSIVGAERSRYFHWNPIEDASALWSQGLAEVARAPRTYRPPSWEIDASELRLGDPYPGQANGVDLRVDQASNLRTDDGQLVPAAPDLVAAIVERNNYRRARRTPAGHLIARVDPEGSSETDWRFLGKLDLPEASNPEAEAATAVRYRLRSSSGKRVIAFEDTLTRGRVRFALGPDRSSVPEAGEARDRLLQWAKELEMERHVEAREILWSADQGYWMELGGERIPFPERLAPLEFAE